MSEAVKEIIKEYTEYKKEKDIEHEIVDKGQVLYSQKNNIEHFAYIEKTQDLRHQFEQSRNRQKDFDSPKFIYRLKKAILMDSGAPEKSLNLFKIMDILTLDDFIGLLKAHNMV